MTDNSEDNMSPTDTTDQMAQAVDLVARAILADMGEAERTTDDYNP